MIYGHPKAQFNYCGCSIAAAVNHHSAPPPLQERVGREREKYIYRERGVEREKYIYRERGVEREKYIYRERGVEREVY